MKKIALVVAMVTAGIAVNAQAAGNRPVLVQQGSVHSENLASPMTRGERAQLTSQIVQKWSYYVQKVKGTAPSVWTRSMSAAFRTADPSNLRRAAKMETYEGMVGVLLGHNTRDDQVINTFATSKQPGTLTAQLLGSPAADMVYNVVTPCRIFDTRVAGGIILAGQTRDFIAYNPGGNFSVQGGDAASDCGVPAYAAAVVVNVTDVLPIVNNFITVWPYGETRPNTATILGVKNGNVSNETVIKITQGGLYHFSAYAFGKADLVGDVVGYFSAPEATALDCTAVTVVSPSVPAGTTVSVEASCPSGYTITGGGFNVTGNTTNASDWTMNESYPQGNKWKVSATNHHPTDADTIQERAECCRVPGH
jgi:hypothetical protein